MSEPKNTHTVPSQKREYIPLLMKDYSTFDIILFSYNTPIRDIEKMCVPSSKRNGKDSTQPFVYNISRLVCTDGHKGIEILLMRGMNPNLKIGKYPLLYVASVKVMKVLLEYGADPNLKIGSPPTSIIHYLLGHKAYAEKRLVDEKIQILIAAGLDLESTFSKKGTLRDILIDAGKEDIISNNPYTTFSASTRITSTSAISLFKDSQQEGKIFIRHLKLKDFLFENVTNFGYCPARNYEWEKFYGYGPYKNPFCDKLLSATTKKDFEEIYELFLSREMSHKKKIIDVEIKL